MHTIPNDKITITLCPENSQEFSDFIKVLNLLSERREIKVKIISLAKLYQDNLFNNLLERANFNYELLEVPLIFKSNLSFPYLSSFKKILTIILNRKRIYKFASRSNIFLIGIQSVFQRLLYYCPGAKGKTVSFHRAILFPTSSKTSRVMTVPNILKRFLSLLEIDYLISPKSGLGYADYYLVIGKNNKKYLELNGVPSEKILITGSPSYDEIEKFKGLNKENFFNKRGLNLYYITSAFEWIGNNKGENYQRRKIRKIIHLCRNNPEIKLTLRIHPREPIKKYQEFKKEFPFINIDYYNSTDLFQDLAKYDIICGGLSNVLFESMLLDKVVVFYLLEEEIPRYKKTLDFTKIKYFTGISQIKSFIEKLRHSESTISSIIKGQKNIVDKIIYYDPKEKASERIVNFLLNLAQKRKIKK